MELSSRNFHQTRVKFKSESSITHQMKFIYLVVFQFVIRTADHYYLIIYTFLIRKISQMNTL